jgi:hypothetical protein
MISRLPSEVVPTKNWIGSSHSALDACHQFPSSNSGSCPLMFALGGQSSAPRGFGRD